ncbi:SPT3 Dosage dependent suppressor of Ty-induced promoter mutations-like protein [Actinomortierella ambigua]|nr:SPT3 Dosage dependent suppressor of Ty-induced promoter mutations-like protein [Actinomortierella ambigua]
MSAFITAGLEDPSSASSPFSGDSSPPAPHPPIIDQHHHPLATHPQPSHSQLELQHQHFQAQLQLQHLQSQKHQRQLDTDALSSALPLPPLATSVNHIPTVSFTGTSYQTFATLNPTTSSPSTFPLHPLSSGSDLFIPYLTPSTASDSASAFSTMDVLPVASFPEPTLAQVHTYQQPYYRSIVAGTQLSPNAKQSHEAVVAHIHQHSHQDHGQGYAAQLKSASNTAILDLSSSSSPPSAGHHQPLAYPPTSSNGTHFADDDFLRRMSQSSVGSDMTQRLLDSRVKLEHTFVTPPSGYKLDARIIQKKDQIDELSTPGYRAPARSVEEVRTGQQFLIKLQFLRADGSHATEFPAMRLERRNAINTSGEPASESEALTLEIIVRLEKSGQVRRGACAKCCHKYGPSSPILLLLDPLSPSPTDPAMYSHIDIYTGSLTLLAKVICSSTDHSERGNKDKYIFEFRVKRNSASSSSMRSSLSPGLGEVSDDSEMNGGEILATCTTTPVMCSGHHKAKRLLVDQRVEKANRGTPTPKTKVIKHRKTPDGSVSPPHFVTDSDTPSEHATPGPMAYSPSTYPTSLALTPSMLDARMMSQDAHSPSSLLPLFPDALSRTTPQPQQQTPSLDDYVASHLGSTLMPPTPSTTAGLSPVSAAPTSPSIIEIRPNQGPIRKVTHVAIRGQSFRAGMVPYFGCFPASDIVVETSALLLCRAPESPLPGTVPVTICEGVGTSYTNLAEFTYTDDNETELLILQLQLRMAHRALEYLHAQATGQHGTATDILRSIPAHLSSPSGSGGSPGATTHSNVADASDAADDAQAASDGYPTQSQSSEQRPLTLEQVEQGLLKTIEHLPTDIDISMQLEDGSNLLHLSILMGFARLAIELVSLGCEIEARDRWGFTPLMYAVFKGQADVAHALVQAGVSAGGAKTPEEFYARLGRTVERTPEVLNLLTTACGRYQPEEYSQWLPGLAHPAQVKTEETAQPLVGASATGINSHSDVNQEAIVSRLPRLLEGLHVLTAVSPRRHQSLPLLEDVIADEQDGVQSSKTILSQQLADDPESTVGPSSKQGDAFDEASGSVGGAATTAEQQESGYHSGVISEVQTRLKELHRQQLPSTGIEMKVQLRCLETSSAMPAPSSTSSTSTMLAPSSTSTMVAKAVAAALGGSEAATAGSSSSSSSSSKAAMVTAGGPSSSSRATESAMASSPFRTGEYFMFDFDLTVNAMMAEGLVLPSSYLGLRFPPELVKRISGKAPSLLSEMTYDIRCSVELGPRDAAAAAAKEGGEGDRIKIVGACKDCNKRSHEQGRSSPTRSMMKSVDWSPALQFGIPMSSDHPQHPAPLMDGGVVEVRQGRCEVRGRVRCSSMHQVVQREKERFMAIKREREQVQTQLQQQGSSEYDPQWKAKLQAEANKAIKELRDPGYIFVFELIHPTTQEAVATTRTGPWCFARSNDASK